MTVRIFRSSDIGAPSLTGQVGSLINVLDACLVNGFSSFNISSITLSGSTATVTTALPHGMQLGSEANRVTIQGAAQTEYNVSDALITITGSYSFTYQVTGTPVSPATGTITAKKISIGWSKLSGTNLAAYRAPTGTRMFLQVDDTGTTTARAYGFENMTDVSTGSGQFPLPTQFAGGVYIYKSGSVDSVVRPWVMMTNGTMFYLWVDPYTAYGSSYYSAMPGVFAFGDIASYKVGDAYNCIIIGASGGPIPNNQPQNNMFAWVDFSSNVGTTCHYMPRPSNQLGASINVCKFTDAIRAGNNHMGSSGAPYPSPIDGGLYMGPIYISETSGHIRGVLPGIWCPYHPAPFPTFTRITGAGPYSGKTFEAFLMAIAAQNGWYSGACEFLAETSNTW